MSEDKDKEIWEKNKKQNPGTYRTIKPKEKDNLGMIFKTSTLRMIQCDCGKEVIINNYRIRKPKNFNDINFNDIKMKIDRVDYAKCDCGIMWIMDHTTIEMAKSLLGLEVKYTKMSVEKDMNLKKAS